MHPTEKTVRQFHESWDMRDPDRGAEVIAENCDFEDIARGETLTGKEAYKEDYHRWREAFPDGLCKVENVIVSQCGEWATVEFRNTGTHTGVLRSSLGDFPPTENAPRFAIARSCASRTAWWSKGATTMTALQLRGSWGWSIKPKASELTHQRPHMRARTTSEWRDCPPTGRLGLLRPTAAPGSSGPSTLPQLSTAQNPKRVISQ